MILGLYQVRVTRVHASHFGTRSFYKPFYRGLYTQPWEVFLDDYPTAWGFESEEEAWKACEQHALTQGDTYEGSHID